MLKTKIICTAILIMFPLFGFAQDILKDFEKILIRNVTVIDQSQQTEDVVVSILIEQKELELISQDKIPISEADITLDANGGFVLGTLEVGTPAAFIILDQDPRTNANVILDTKTYAVFAVSKGDVVLNKLIRIDVESKEQLSGWTSYSPPPVALPLSYQNKRKWNVVRTKPITALFGGAILMEKHTLALARPCKQRASGRSRRI